MGTSRYKPLVKLKKKSLDEAERDLISANNDVSAAAQRLDRAYEILRTLSLPQQGCIRELSQANLIIQAQHLLVEQCIEALKNAQNNQQQKREFYNRAMVEFEKFNYLEAHELGARMKKIKDQEAKILDELGRMTYTREKG